MDAVAGADAVGHRFSLIESIPPSADLHHAVAPVEATTPPLPQTPVRRPRFRPHEIETFLADLEPGSIFEALVPSSKQSPQTAGRDTAGKDAKRDFIRATVANASSTEKLWGVKAAHAGQSINEWHDELASWPWPKPGQRNGFLAQYNEDQLARSFPPAGPEAYRASVPSGQIETYEKKVDGIRKYLGMLELDDLKAYVRTAHVTPNAQRTSQQSPAEAASYDNMDDFTALVTATIVQSLPKLARLSSLMNTWSVRLTIMRMVPDFIRDLDSCKDSMLSARMAIGIHSPQTPTEVPASTTSTRKSFQRNVLDDMRAVLNDQISETGKKLDLMLELLEGSNDVLPEQWIDTMDDLEEEHKAWMVKAEELVLDNELATVKASVSHKDELDFLRNVSHASQFLQISADDVRALGSLSSHPENGEGDAESHANPGVTTMDESTPSPFPGSTLTHPVRNVSNGVRKPTGLPRDDTAEAMTRKPSSKPSPVIMERQVSGAESNATSEGVSSMSRSGSVDSDLLSIGSSLEIQSATVAAYPGSPIKVTTPSLSSRLSMDFPDGSQDHDFYNCNKRRSWSGGSLHPNPLASHQRKRSSTFTASRRPPSSRNDPLKLGHVASKASVADIRAKSASIKSFEVIPRSEVRTIDVRRSTANSSSTSLSRADPSEYPFPQRTSVDTQPGLVNGYGNGYAGSSSEISFPGPAVAQDRFTSNDFYNEPHLYSKQQTPERDSGRISFSKTRKLFKPAASSDGGTKKRAGQQRAVTLGDSATKTNTNGSLLQGGDRLDAQINSILTQIPANIHLTSAAGGATSTDPDAKAMNKSPNEKSNHLRRVSVARLIRPKASTTPTAQPMTLAPAASESRSNGSSEIKIYHLHKPGATSPTTLHVRLVGGGSSGVQRVMVRVGGGWADFGEYLKEYAAHRGQRAVSENHFNIQSFSPQQQTSSPPVTRPPSSSSSFSSPFFRRQQTTPTASMANGVATGYTSSPPSRPRTPSFGSKLGWRRGSRSNSRPTSSWDDPINNISTPPPPPHPPSSSATIGNNVEAESSPSPAASYGLAGRRTKEVDISPRKQAWVDSMMMQARRTSGNNNNDNNSSHVNGGNGVGEGAVGMGARGEGRTSRTVSGGGGGGGGVKRVFLGVRQR